MLEAVPIDIALWGMIVCEAIKTAQVDRDRFLRMK
jgi:hypothetical protein